MAPTSKSRKAPPDPRNLHAAVLDLLALAWAYESSAGRTPDPKADLVLHDFVEMMKQVWEEFTSRAARSPISERLVDRVAAAYEKVTPGSSHATLKQGLAEVFESEGTAISDDELDQLLLTRQQIIDRLGDSAGGPKESARSQLGKVFGDVSANTVKRIARDHGELGIPFSLTPFAYGRGPSLTAIEKYILAILASEREKTAG